MDSKNIIEKYSFFLSGEKIYKDLANDEETLSLLFYYYLEKINNNFKKSFTKYFIHNFTYITLCECNIDFDKDIFFITFFFNNSDHNYENIKITDKNILENFPKYMKYKDNIIDLIVYMFYINNQNENINYNLLYNILHNDKFLIRFENDGFIEFEYNIDNKQSLRFAYSNE